jgi:O-acetyl-ADP-ribose deacetylase (regulator of RNase III)
MKLILCDERTEVLDAWKAQFLERPEVEIRKDDLLKSPTDAFLLPGNSFGFLDSGLELRVLETYGPEVQDELRQRIRAEHDGELLVGQALIFRWPSMTKTMVYAPIWRTPRRLQGTLHVFLLARGAFLALKKAATAQGQGQAPAIHSLALSGLGTDAGLDPLISARQIRYAYEIASGLRGPGDKNLSQLQRREKKLMSLPGAGKEELRD